MSFLPYDLATAPPVSGPSVVWEEPDCLLCGGRRWSTLVEAPDWSAGSAGLWFAAVQCHDCGLCFTNPRPTQATIGQFYPATYGPYQARTPRPSLRWHLPFPGALGKNLRYGLPHQGQRRLLDFGCGAGGYLERMHRQGWQVTGLDVSRRMVESIQERLGIRALVGSLPHPELAPESFDVITMWQSLEHVHEPHQVVVEAHRLLAPGGTLIVAVPNIDSLPFRWFGHAWFGLDLPRHLTHFAPWTLQLLLHRAGFRVESIKMVRHSKWLRSSAERGCRDAASPRWQRWLAGKPGSRLATWYGFLTHQSDCMVATAHKMTLAG